MSPTYQLSEAELQYCIKIGNDRQETNVKNNIASKQFTSRDPTNIHIQGVIGEYAFAKLCESLANDTKTDITKTLNDTRSRGTKNDKQDWTINKKTIDVKTTLNKRAQQIYARLHKIRNPAHFYVLILIEFLDPATHQPISISPQLYDQMFGLLQQNTRQFDVRCTFQGFVESKELFSHYVEQDKSYTSKVNPSWSEFCAQILETNEVNEVRTVQCTCGNGC